MQQHERDLDLISMILADCATLRDRIEYFGTTADSFVNDHSREGEIAYDAIMTPVYRIAEDALHLSAAVINAFPDYPWDDIRGFRNYVAHGYREVDRSIAWKVVEVDIPQLETLLTTYEPFEKAAALS